MLRVASAQNICFNFSCLAETGLKLAPAQELKIESKREKNTPCGFTTRNHITADFSTHWL